MSGIYIVFSGVELLRFEVIPLTEKRMEEVQDFHNSRNGNGLNDWIEDETNVENNQIQIEDIGLTGWMGDEL